MSAVPVMDGTADAEYGAALSVQNTNTQFGNANSGDPINAGGGSEIDQVFARVSSGRLYVVVAGNLETNFNKLEIFIDSEAGGVNLLDGFSLPGGVDSFCCGGFPPPDGGNIDNAGALQRMDFLTFDAGFNADHYLTFTHGFENALSPPLGFYAASAHYADLTAGTAGPSGGLGIQLAQRGLPQVLRGTTADFETDGDVDGGDFLQWQQNQGAIVGATRAQGDGDGNGAVNADDLNLWALKFGFDVANATFDADYFAPQNANADNSNALLGPALPGLNQGDLIDKTYAMGPGGAIDNAGTGALTRELEFVLPPVAGTDNEASHRNLQNFIDLKMAIDNSNTAGVSGDGPFETPTTGNPQEVRTGVEFSVPLSVLGNPAGPIKLLAFVNGTGHDFLSNQASGEGLLTGNLGVPVRDFELEFPGNQYVTIPNPAVPAAGTVPEPVGLVLMGLAAAALRMHSRRRR